MKVLQKIRFQVHSDLNYLNRVLLQFDRLYRDFIPQSDWLQCKLALAEGFTNAVRHAHKNLPPEVPIIIEALLTETTIEIYIWDRGAPFDLHQYIAQAAQNQNNLFLGGRGIPILIKIADRLDYYRTAAEQNCLLIVKELSLSARTE